MNEAELREKVDELGKAVRALEDKQLQFEFDNRDTLEFISETKDELKKIFLERKEGMETPTMTVQYRKGAVKWETKWLDGFAIDHPEFNLGQYRKVQKPTVAFVPKGDPGWDEGM